LVACVGLGCSCAGVERCVLGGVPSPFLAWGFRAWFAVGWSFCWVVGLLWLAVCVVVCCCGWRVGRLPCPCVAGVCCAVGGWCGSGGVLSLLWVVVGVLVLGVGVWVVVFGSGVWVFGCVVVCVYCECAGLVFLGVSLLGGLVVVCVCVCVVSRCWVWWGGWGVFWCWAGGAGACCGGGGCGGGRVGGWRLVVVVGESVWSDFLCCVSSSWGPGLLLDLREVGSGGFAGSVGVWCAPVLRRCIVLVVSHRWR